MSRKWNHFEKFLIESAAFDVKYRLFSKKLAVKVLKSILRNRSEEAINKKLNSKLNV